MADSSPLAHSPTLVSTPGAGGERLEHGAKVGEYVVERFLGAGAMGEVYAGVHPVIGKKVAIKILKREVAASPDGAERFKREARAVNQVDHPNVIDIFSFGRLDDGRLYLVMDLVEGQSLRKALADGALDIETSLDVLAAIADALDAAHARGVIHRDLKPDNVMLSSATPPKVSVLDFGLAKLLTGADGVSPASMLTGQGTWLGTPGYMAPEQWSADGAGPASDRYSLGVMAFEMLSGSLPFQATSLPQMMEQHFRAKVPALSTRGAIQARSSFDPVVSRAMAKDPDARFSTAREMVDALRAAAGTRTRRPASGSRTPWLPAVAGAAVLGLSIAGVVLVRGNGERSEVRAAETDDDHLGSAALAAGMSRVAIRSTPPNAEVVRGDGRPIGSTPTEIEAPVGSAISFRVRMPGYATVSHALRMPASSSALPMFVLSPISGFEGVWAMPGGELRGFKRTDDGRVEISKLRSVDGERQFYRHYTLVAADQGIEFATTETVISPKAPNEPSCHIPQQVVYHYDPQPESLSFRREAVLFDLVGGKCIVKSAAFDAPVALTRVDVSSSTETLSLPPVGLPGKEVAENTRKAESQLKAKLDAEQQASKKPRQNPKLLVPATGTDDGNANVGNLPDSARPPAQQAPQNAPPDAQNAPAQQPANPPVPMPPTGNAPAKNAVRGDSQVAPAVDLPRQQQKKK